MGALLEQEGLPGGSAGRSAVEAAEEKPSEPARVDGVQEAGQVKVRLEIGRLLGERERLILLLVHLLEACRSGVQGCEGVGPPCALRACGLVGREV